MLKTFEIRNFPTDLKRVETFRHTIDPIHQLIFLLVRINEARVFMPEIISRRSLLIAVPNNHSPPPYPIWQNLLLFSFFIHFWSPPRPYPLKQIHHFTPTPLKQNQKTRWGSPVDRRTSTPEASPIGKIHPFSKMT